MTRNEIKSITHDECQSSIPAYIHGKLTSDESRAVQNHIAHCDVCFHIQQEALDIRNDLDEPIVEIESLLNSHAMEKNLQHTLDNIDKLKNTESVKKASRKPSILNTLFHDWLMIPKGFRIMMIAQTLCILMLLGGIGYFMKPSGIEPMISNEQLKLYTTLSDSDDNVIFNSLENDYQFFRVVFHEATTERDIRTILNSVSAQIISGPSIEGVYTVSVLREQQDYVVLNGLRNSAWIRLAEPVRY